MCRRIAHMCTGNTCLHGREGVQECNHRATECNKAHNVFLDQRPFSPSMCRTRWHSNDYLHALLLRWTERNAQRSLYRNPFENRYEVANRSFTYSRRGHVYIYIYICTLMHSLYEQKLFKRHTETRRRTFHSTAKVEARFVREQKRNKFSLFLADQFIYMRFKGFVSFFFITHDDARVNIRD